MKLLTKALLKKLPSTDVAPSAEDPIVWVKFFYPDFSWTWYMCGYDPDTEVAWGLVDGWEIEVGDFSVKELRQTKGKLGLGIERDLYFAPQPLSELIKELKKQHRDRRIWGWSN